MKAKRMNSAEKRDAVDILEYLIDRREKFIKADLITEKFNITSAYLRKIIHYLRVCACPIISTSKGYCYTFNQDKIIENINSLNNRGMSVLEAASGLMQSLHDVNVY